MRVYIANFGVGNYEWPRCLKGSTVANMIHEHAKPFYDAGDKKGFVDWCIKNRKTARGITPTKPVASRWFGSMQVVENTSDDVWIHRAGDELWWTTSKGDPPEWSLEPSQDPQLAGHNVWLCHKPCNPWSNRDQLGRPLRWTGLHPKAKHFLFTEGTLQALSDDNAEYALSLIEGADLSAWHIRQNWKDAEKKAGRGAGTSLDEKQKTVWNIVRRVKSTVATSNGQMEERIVKNKELRMSENALSAYIEELIANQEGLCAITGIKLQYDGEETDQELLCSLDRIDSDGHYEAGNLQVVCRFVNRWKSDDSDSEFRRLIGVLLEQAQV